VFDAAAAIAARLRNGGRLWVETDCEEAVLVDAAEGSTWVACALADCDNLTIGRQVSTAEATEKRLADLLGYSVVIPLG